MKAIQKVPPKFDKLSPSIKAYKKEKMPKPTIICMKFDTTFPMVTATDFFEKFTDTEDLLKDRDTYAEGEILENRGNMLVSYCMTKKPEKNPSLQREYLQE